MIQVTRRIFKAKLVDRPRYNATDHLISALNKHIKGLEKQLDEKQIIIGMLLQNIHNCSNNNIVASSNYKADKGSFENVNSHEKSKMIFPRNQIELTATVRIISTIIRD